MNLPDGYVFRPAAHDDIPAIVEVLNALSIEAIGGPDTTEQSILDRYSQPDFDMDRDTAVIDFDGIVAGYEFIRSIAPFATADVEGAVDPNHRGRGLGAALIEWAIERLKENIPHAPDHIRIAPHFYTFANHEPSTELMTSFGMRHVRTYFEMAITFDGPPPPPRLPDHLRLVSFTDPSVDELVAYGSMREAFADHFGFFDTPVEEGFARFSAWKASPEFDPTLFWQLVDGDEYAGNIWCWPHSDSTPDNGYVANIGVRPKWRRRGLATAMLLHAFGEFHRRGNAGVDLGVDAESLTGATRLYEAVGMKPINSFNAFEMVLRDGEDVTRS